MICNGLRNGTVQQTGIIIARWPDGTDASVLMVSVKEALAAYRARYGVPKGR